MRIRTVKPDFWSSGKQLRLSDQAALLIIALWNQADDDGRMVDDPLQIAAMCPRMVGRVDQYLSELERGTFLHRYRNITGKRYIQIHDWKHHQRISKPQQSRIPAMTSDDMKTIPQLFPERSGNVPQPFHTEGKGREWNGIKEKESVSLSPNNIESKTPVGAPPGYGDPDGFAEFWTPYPRKVGRAAAVSEWKRIPMDTTLRARIIAAIPVHAAGALWQSGCVHNPATWLREKHWEDEVEPGEVSTTAPAPRWCRCGGLIEAGIDGKKCKACVDDAKMARHGVTA